MANVHAHPKRSVMDLLAAVQRLDSAELRQFARGLAALQGPDGNEDPVAEEILLTLIRKNSNLPALEQRRFIRLRRQLQDEKLTKLEEKELQELWRRVEQMNATRLAALAELARLRHTDIRSLMRELGIAENLDAF